MMTPLLSAFLLVAGFRAIVEGQDGIRMGLRVSLRRAFLTCCFVAAVLLYHATDWPLLTILGGWAFISGMSIFISRPMRFKTLRDAMTASVARLAMAILVLHVVIGVYIEGVVHPAWLMAAVPVIFTLIYIASIKWVFGRWLEKVPIEMPYDQDLRHRFQPERIGMVRSKVIYLPMNALFMGLFSTGRVWLSDRIVAGLRSIELKAIIHHELGHATARHLRLRLGLLVVVYATLFGSAWFAFSTFASPRDALVGFIALTWTLMAGLEALAYDVAQRQEFKADAFAKAVGYGDALADAIEAIRRREPERKHTALYHRLFVSHPRHEERIKRLRL